MVVFAESTEDVQLVLREANRVKCPVVPYNGGTSLVSIAGLVTVPVMRGKRADPFGSHVSRKVTSLLHTVESVLIFPAWTKPSVLAFRIAT